MIVYSICELLKERKVGCEIFVFQAPGLFLYGKKEIVDEEGVYRMSADTPRLRITTEKLLAEIGEATSRTKQKY